MVAHSIHPVPESGIICLPAIPFQRLDLECDSSRAQHGSSAEDGESYLLSGVKALKD